MGKLLKRRGREEREQIRRERRDQVRRLAREAFSHRPFWEVDMDGLGKQIGLRPGATVFLFQTKEHLLLDLLRGELERWREAVGERLQAGSKDAVGCLVETLADAEILGRLLTMLPEALDGGVDMLDAVSFLRWWQGMTEELGALMEGEDAVPLGGGAELVRKALRLLAGAHPFARPTGEVTLAFDDPAVVSLKVDLAAEISSLLRAWLTSLEAAQS